MKILVTGLCGFIGHHTCEHLLKNTNWDIIGLDKLTYASNGFDRLRDIDAFDNNRVKLFTLDFTKKLDVGLIQEIGQVDYILHMGAETHVDRSIDDPRPFIETNILGTYNMLEYAKGLTKLKAFIYFSTDEVFGPAPEGTKYKEWARYNSGNPYAASKAGGEELTLAYGNTYKLPVIITHTMNCIGERQHPEKFVPMCIKKILNGEEVIIHANKDKTKSGSRHWIHARNVADAILFLLDGAETQDKYNIVGEEMSNLEVAQLIADIMGKPLKYKMVDFHSSRPGHDLRYALDGTKMAELGWTPPKDLRASLEKTIKWFLENKKWL
jgi:dTDP-glucose 4,6-dehydratase